MKAGNVLMAAALALLPAAASVSAHHSFAAEFDATKPITLEGVITKIELINPHGWIYMDVKGADGRVQNWAVETGSAAALARAGLRRANLTAGTRLEVKGYRAKDGSPTINGNVITLADGQDRSLGSSLGSTP
jgi:hypothetical protein